MSLLSVVLSKIAERLRLLGAEISPLPLENISSVMSFLEAMKIALDDDLAVAACLASILASSDARQIATDLGISQDLLPPPYPVGLREDLYLCHLLLIAERRQAIVVASMLYAMYTAGAKKGLEEPLATIRRMAEIATEDGSKNQSVARELFAKIGQVQILPAPALESSDYVFSISIDLVGSTDAKTRAMHLAKGVAKKIDDLNKRIYWEFCRIEKRFYETAVGRSGPVDPARFFTVKGIGDEIWILCATADADIRKIGRSLIDAAMEVAAQSVNFLATENDEANTFDPPFDYGKVEPIKSPIKVFMDLLSQGSCLGELRDRDIARAVPGLLKSFHLREPLEREIVYVARRLCLSSYEPIGRGKVINQFRTDYIGHEVDRFFRTTKAAIPGTLTIGESMASKMGLSVKPRAGEIYTVLTETNEALAVSFPLDPVYASVRTLSADQLKGIGYEYRTYTLFSPRSLNAIYRQMNSDRENGFPVMPYDDTANLIPPKIVEEIFRSSFQGKVPA
jgi:hypothetical protein